MQADHTNMPGDASPQEPPKSGMSGCLKGCLIFSIVMLVLCAGGGIFLYTQGPSILVGWGRKAVSAVLEEAELPAGEQQAVMVQFDRVGDAFIAGDISWEDTGLLLQDLAQSPVMTFAVLVGVEKKYLDSSGLSEEEKAEAKRTMVRISRGIMEDKFESGELDKISSYVLENPGTEKAKPKEQLTDEELRSFMAEAKALCDEKEIPDEDFDMKISEKLKEIIDNRLGTAE